MSIVDVRDSDHLNNVIAESNLTAVYYTASWCQPCKKLSPIMEKIAKEVEGVTIARADVDVVSPLTMVMSVPIIHLYQNGVVQEELHAPSKESQITQTIKKYV